MMPTPACTPTAVEGSVRLLARCLIAAGTWPDADQLSAAPADAAAAIARHQPQLGAADVRAWARLSSEYVGRLQML